MNRRLTILAATSLAAVMAWPRAGFAQPWLDTKHSLDERAALLTAALTQDEKQTLLHGYFAVEIPGTPQHKPPGALGSAGYVPGIARLGIPALQQTDAGLGVVNPGGVTRPGDTAVALPSGLATAATFNTDLAYANGAALGREAASRGFNVVLGGGVNLARDPRGGRNFEYAGEDPLLAGMIVGATVRGTQDQHVISTVKHFAGNDQESLRDSYDVELTEEDRRESDLLAFEIAIEQGHPGAVMCAYNRIGGPYACENPTLLTKILKGDWGYPGWVLSDWGAVHSAATAFNAGLDQESGEQLDTKVFFDAPLRAAINKGDVAQTRVDDAVHRILRGVLGAGLMDGTKRPARDDAGGLKAARATASEAIVLLANHHHSLPLSDLPQAGVPLKYQCVAVIGGDSDAGVPAGGGSSQVTPLGGFARQRALGGRGIDSFFRNLGIDGPSPLSRIEARLPGVRVFWVDGRYPSQAAMMAKFCRAAIVFATQWSGENADIPDLSLPDGQDATIDAVTKANPRTIVVLQTAGAVRMPWLEQAGAVVEAWYSGNAGADAIADVLFGTVNPSGRLPVTFPVSEADLPKPEIMGMYIPQGTAIRLVYPEGPNVGYRWYAWTGKKPLFPFGFGLSYTQFAYSNLKVTGGAGLHAEFDVRNTGSVAGADVPQLYSVTHTATPVQRLLGWKKLYLKPGESAHVALDADKRLLCSFLPRAHAWGRLPLDVTVAVGANAGDLALSATVGVGVLNVRP
jgi:beta-glucosidase